MAEIFPKAHVIHKVPDPVLAMTAHSVDHISSDILRFIERLSETLYQQPGGIGIAAPQIGVLKRIAIVDVSPKDKTKERLVLVNPELMWARNYVTFREGCMSVPDFTGNVERAQHIKVRWQDETQTWREMETTGIEAVCIQHEIDHLNGKVFLDRVTSLKTDVFPRKRYLK